MGVSTKVTRRSIALFVGLVLLSNAALSNALQVSAFRSRRQLLAPRGRDGRDTRFLSISRSTSQEGPSIGSRSELHTYTSGTTEAISTGGDISKRRSLLRLSAFAVFLTVTVPKLLPALQSLFEVYNHCLITNPLITKVATGGALATFGDALAQTSEKDKPYDKLRAASFASFDSCYRVFQHMAFPFIIGNCQGRVFSRLLSAVPGLSVTATPVMAVCERVLTYQLMVVPLLYYPVFFTFTGFMQGLDAKATFQRAKANFLPCWKKNLLFWVPIQAFMFGLVPERFQVSFTCIMGIIWSLILSVTAGKANKE